MTILATGWAVVRPAAQRLEARRRMGIPLRRKNGIYLRSPFLERTTKQTKARGARAVRCEVREIGGEG